MMTQKLLDERDMILDRVTLEQGNLIAANNGSNSVCCYGRGCGSWI